MDLHGMASLCGTTDHEAPPIHLAWPVFTDMPVRVVRLVPKTWTVGVMRTVSVVRLGSFVRPVFASTPVWWARSDRAVHPIYVTQPVRLVRSLVALHSDATAPGFTDTSRRHHQVTVPDRSHASMTRTRTGRSLRFGVGRRRRSSRCAGTPVEMRSQSRTRVTRLRLGPSVRHDLRHLDHLLGALAFGLPYPCARLLLPDLPDP